MRQKYPANFEKTTKKVSGVYSITHAPSGKTYIGSSAEIFRRWRGHFLHLEAGKHVNCHLQSAWAKHGSAEFSFCILEVCEPEELMAKEQVHIDSISEDLRYNLSPVSGSVLGMTWSLAPETKTAQSRRQRLLTDEQIAEAKELYLSGKTYAQIGERYGVGYNVVYYAVRNKLFDNSSGPVVGVIRRKRTPEMRARFREARKNRPPVTAETREKLRAAMKGRVFTDEHRAKLSATAKTRNYTPEGRAAIGAAKRKFYAEHPEALERLAEVSRNRTPETRAKLANWERTPKVLARMSAAHKGKVHSPETRARIAEANRARWAARKASQISPA